MKRIVHLLMLVALPFATLSSCQMNYDEPDGIHELRLAKAEFIKAQAAVEAAKATYEAAVAKEKEALVELQLLKNETLRLQNEMLAATNEKDKLALQLLMEEAQKSHEIKMKNLETEMVEANIAYEIALLDFQVAMVEINEEQTSTLNAIIQRLNGNRFAYEQVINNITHYEIAKMEVSLNQADTTAILQVLNAAVSQAQYNYDNSKFANDLYNAYNGVTPGTADANLESLLTQIRAQVDSYNADLNQYYVYSDQKAIQAENESNATKARTAELVSKYNVKANYVSPSIDAAIQSDFIPLVAARSAELDNWQATLEHNNGIVKTVIDGKDYYSLSGGTLTAAIKPTTATKNPVYSTSTQQNIVNFYKELTKSVKGKYATDLSKAYAALQFNALSLTDADSDEKFAEAIKRVTENKQSAVSVTEKYNALYQTSLASWNAAVAPAKAAKDAYMRESNLGEMSGFAYLQEYVKQNYSDVMTETGVKGVNETVARALAAEMVTFLNNRQNLDGYVDLIAKTSTTPAMRLSDAISADFKYMFTAVASTDPVVYTLNTSNYAKVTANGGTALKSDAKTGPNTIVNGEIVTFDVNKNMSYAQYPFGAFVMASNEAFGTSATETKFDKLVWTAPDATVLHKIGASNYLGTDIAIGGRFGTYYNVFVGLQDILKAESWASLYSNTSQAYTNAQATLIEYSLYETSSKIALEDAVIAGSEATQKLMDAIALRIGTPSSRTNITVTVTKPAAAGYNAQLVTLTNAPASLKGTTGIALNNLKAVYDAVATSTATLDYNSQLAAAKDVVGSDLHLADMMTKLTAAKNAIADFHANGYKVTEGSVANTVFVFYVDSTTSISVTKTGSDYKVMLAQAGDKESMSDSSNSGLHDDVTVSYTELSYNDPRYTVAVEAYEASVTSTGIAVESQYLTVILAEYDAVINNLMNEKERLDVEFKMIEAEKDAFIAAIGAELE